MNTTVSAIIVVVTLANILACVWLMWWTAKRRDVGAGPKTGHVWDGDLEEYNNPLPRWWLGLFIITIIFSLIYLVLYPGLGNFAGVKGWTQTGEHAKDVADAEARFNQHLSGIESSSIEALSHNDKAMRTARNLFGLYCSTCHGSDARGAKGFPNLTDNDWLWGGSPDTIQQTISGGRAGVMPPWGPVLGPQGVNEVAAYVVSLSGGKAPAELLEAGKTKFATFCVACHGVDGKGNQALGAPNLTDDIWLYGGSYDAVRETIANGRTNQMPAHTELLGPVKVKLMAAYVLSLSQPAAAP